MTIFDEVPKEVLLTEIHAEVRKIAPKMVRKT
jgi:hypothetical protein